MPKFRKKPVMIEAVQYLGHYTDEIKDLFGGATHLFTPQNGLKIATLEGVMHVSVGDWIIKGVQGEFYPCKPDIFEETYEEVDGVLRSSVRPMWDSDETS